MTLHEQIKNDMKEAMKAKESNKVVVLRGLMSACTNELVAQKKDPSRYS
ncbi:MAG: GatB/YqeY domain-containing protein [Candidatus Pacebacteria bacterium]|nr:GatB/YqeY domain-containing protein [Candidatus Paceibacterota bacterium]